MTQTSNEFFLENIEMTLKEAKHFLQQTHIMSAQLKIPADDIQWDSRNNIYFDTRNNVKYKCYDPPIIKQFPHHKFQPVFIAV